jgi:hypothetical protein
MNEDILELVYLVMRQAVEDAEADLKAVMDEIRARNERLHRWRKLVADLEAHRDGAANEDLIRSAGKIIADQLSTPSEMSELMQLRLQMALDRRSKFEEALSNLLKKQSDTAAAIIRNLK